MGKSLKTVRNKLQLSKLDSQAELLSDDLDLSQLAFITNKLPTMRFDESVVAGEVNRTIEGASTVVITVNDRYGYIRRSGRLASRVDIKMDGLWFRLVKVQKTGNDITLTFESREVAILRTYNERRVVGWGKMRRARFAQILVQEVKEFKIPFICPDLQAKPISNKEKKDKAIDRDPGFGFSTNASSRADAAQGLRIKKKPATSEQLRNCEAVLDVGLGMLLKRKLLVCSIMTIIQEATAYNHPYGDVYGPSAPLEQRRLGSVGLFQQQPSWGTFEERMNPKKAARKFFDKAVVEDRANPQITYTALCQEVQVSAHPDAYAQWRDEAERIVTAYGVAGGDISRADAISGFNLQTSFGEDTGIDEFQFMRGRPKTLAGGRKGWEKESSWDCLVRLAEEVNWRCFEVSGSVYFTTETHLFKSAPRARVSEDSEGIDWIDFDYDIGKANATVTLQARLNRWDAPPGTIIEIINMGPANGRWLVSEVRRGIFDKAATVTMKKPRPRFAEPKKEDLTGLWDNQYEDPNYVPTPGFSVDPPTQRPTGKALKDAVLNNGNITFTRTSQKNDIIMGLISDKVLQFLVAFTEAGFPATITSLRSDHSKNVKGTNRPSKHGEGLAVDLGNYGEGNPRTDDAMRWIASFQVELDMVQLIGPIDSLVVPLGYYDQSTLEGHDDHIHVGF